MELSVATDLELLNPKHDEIPVYIPSLKATVGMGHFILISTGSSEPLVGQLLGMCNQQYANVCCFLPLFLNETHWHINSPTILPPKLCWSTCKNLVELVNIGKVAQVHVSSIISVAFVFLEADVRNEQFCIHGILNAYIIRHRYCQSRKAFVLLDNASFSYFPDLHPVYRSLWSECYGRTIFMSIDQLRQEVW
jgi:hypothetical protein